MTRPKSLHNVPATHRVRQPNGTIIDVPNWVLDPVRYLDLQADKVVRRRVKSIPKLAEVIPLSPPAKRGRPPKLIPDLVVINKVKPTTSAPLAPALDPKYQYPNLFRDVPRQPNATYGNQRSFQFGPAWCEAVLAARAYDHPKLLAHAHALNLAPPDELSSLPWRILRTQLAIALRAQTSSLP